jgi:hypothetical protein
VAVQRAQAQALLLPQGLLLLVGTVLLMDAALKYGALWELWIHSQRRDRCRSCPLGHWAVGWLEVLLAICLLYQLVGALGDA